MLWNLLWSYNLNFNNILLQKHWPWRLQIDLPKVICILFLVSKPSQGHKSGRLKNFFSSSYSIPNVKPFKELILVIAPIGMLDLSSTLGLDSVCQMGLRWISLAFPHLFMKEGSLLVLPIGKRLCIYVEFGLGDKILAHSLVNVDMTSVHKMKIFTWV